VPEVWRVFLDSWSCLSSGKARQLSHITHASLELLTRVTVIQVSVYTWISHTRNSAHKNMQYCKVTTEHMKRLLLYFLKREVFQERKRNRPPDRTPGNKAPHGVVRPTHDIHTPLLSSVPCPDVPTKAQTPSNIYNKQHLRMACVWSKALNWSTSDPWGWDFRSNRGGR
jgi:hypothetical protein